MRDKDCDNCQDTRWKNELKDPVREDLVTAKVLPDLDKILTLFPRTQGEPAFDPEVIKGNIEKLKTTPEVDTGHPFLDLSVKTGLASVEATFQGNHPKYGTKEYGKNIHDSFPPTIIAAADALSAWGLTGQAASLFRYWLLNFIQKDGTINYYGSSLSEYGQLLHTAALLTERTGTGTWCKDCFRPLELVVEYLMELLAEDKKEDGLIRGVPEADEQKDPGKYFHNNGWIVKGLHRWVKICELCNFSPSIPIEVIQHNAEQLKKKTLSAIRQRWPKEPEDWWLPPRLEPSPRPACLTDTRLSSYTNYRYWPELLSSGLLPADMANRITEARLSAGGQFCGMTRFADWLDDWPLADYLYALWKLGRKEDFLLSLYGHISYHQAEVHLTAYEQVTFPPGEEKAPYCLPCQIVAARAARLINRK